MARIARHIAPIGAGEGTLQAGHGAIAMAMPSAGSSRITIITTSTTTTTRFAIGFRLLGPFGRCLVLLDRAVGAVWRTLRIHRLTSSPSRV